MRVSDMSGIFGCGSRRNVAILDASKPGPFAMVANGGASPVTPRWSAATTWQGSHHRRASCSPLRASAASAGCAITATVRQQPNTFNLRSAVLIGHGPSFQSWAIFEPVLCGTLCAGSRPHDRFRPSDDHTQRGGVSMTRIVTLAALITVTTGLVQAQNVPERLKGAAFAQQICAECHAVQAGQPRSPNGQAPTFETVAKTPGMTAIALTAILRTSHRNMPNIVLADDDLRNVIAYILTLK